MNPFCSVHACFGFDTDLLNLYTSMEGSWLCNTIHGDHADGKVVRARDSASVRVCDRERERESFKVL